MRINRWLNDPITVDGTEKLYLIRGDEKISLFARGDEHPTMLTYGFGYMCWEKEIYGTKFKLTAFVPEDADVRVFIAECDELRAGDRLCYYTDIVMGGENKTSPTAVTELSDGVISVTDKASPFGDMAFKVCSSNKPIAFTTDKNAYLEGNLDGRLGAGFNLCVATEYSLEKKLVIVTGCDSVDKIKALSQIMTAEKSLSDTKNMWRQRVKPIIVNTPDSDLNSFINGWALYQVYSCRILGRTSIYQNGGAYGFRDQLQDVLSLIPFMPDVAREQIKRASSHQYMEGDVQHWWHSMPDGEHGVRTRISDDLLWLPYVLCRYVTETGDYSICREETGYLMSKELSEDEHDRYEVPEYSGNKDSIYNHAKKAIEKFINRGVGEHGLALIGTGDWNDGMNGVGEKGKGESVWLSLFGAIVLEKMSYLCLKNGEKQISERYSEYSEKLKRASEKAWDGKWFLRGYYDDGRPIGSQDSEECKIDSIAQSFAVFSKIDPEKRKTALKSAYSQLYDRENRIVKLFTPPFDKGAGNPGYIKSYSPGFRENGGQYTHGAVWLSMALLEEGMVKEGYDILHALLPGGRNEEVYKAEPFVIAADVYANENNLGRGGWSWYTGAAGWMYNTATQYLLGLKIRDGRLYIEPNIPDDWGECSVLYRVGNDYIHIEIGKMPERQIKVDGKDYDNSGYSLKIYNNFIFKW
jgi:cyclic beta-1,2-glucan synthetase